MCKVCRISVILIVMIMLVSSSYAGITERVSISSDGVEGNYESGGACISSDDRFIAFESTANNLVSGDTNQVKDIFVHDRLTGKTERISISSNGEQGNNWSQNPSISADGRFVAFESCASNLVLGDTNNNWDIFVYDRQTDITERISISSSGIQGNDRSNSPYISADGRFVAFESYASNFVSGDMNGFYSNDVFVDDRQTGNTECASLTSEGMVGTYSEMDKEFIFIKPSISADGRFVAFDSLADNLVSGDTNGQSDIFVRDLQNGKTERVSVSSEGGQSFSDSSSPSISADGRFVAFHSSFCNYPGVYIYDRLAAKTEYVSKTYHGEPLFGEEPDISSDGRFVYFNSTVLFDYWSGFVYDRQTDKTISISVSSSGMLANNWVRSPSISADGKFVVFSSYGNNLVSGDTNSTSDVFVHELTNVQGKIELSDFTGDITSVPLTVDLGNGLNPIGLNLDSNGKFSIWDPPSGTFDIHIKASHWLAKTITDAVIIGDVDLVATTLINGDVVDNNEVDFSDINAVKAAFGSFPGEPNWNALADVDGNGEVDFTDINIVRSNYGMVGE